MTQTSKEPFKWTKNKAGAPKGNSNHLRHGLFAGKLPKGCQHIENRTLKLRRQLEKLLIDLKGTVGLIDAASVQTALRWERHGLLCQRWLTKEFKTLTPSDRLNFSREIARASVERDKALDRLGLDKGHTDAWLAIDAAPIEPKLSP